MNRMNGVVVAVGLVAGACGSPPAVVAPVSGSTASPGVAVTTVLPGATIHYVACSAVGHASIELVSGQALPAAPQWTISEASANDLARDPTIEQRVRRERPAFAARGGNATIITTGMSRTELERMLATLSSTDGVDDPSAHHAVDGAHLHLPWPAEFDGMTARLGDDFYAARFAYSSVFGGMAKSPSTPIAGGLYPWAVLKSPTKDDGSGPLVTSWHGEVFVHDATFSTDAVGAGVSDASYLAFTEQALGAARAAAPTGCRVRTGGPPYELAADAVPFVRTQVQFADAGRQRTVEVYDDGSVREGGIPIGSFSSNGMMFRYDQGVPRIVGQVDRRETIQVDNLPAATITDTLAAASYSGPAQDRVPVALALWIARH